MAGGKEEVGVINLEYSPTWIIAIVCFVIVSISLLVERILHFLGKFLKDKNQKPLFEALQKVKEELMLLGFISLMLVAFQGSIQRICVPNSLIRHMTPCSIGGSEDVGGVGRRRLLSGGGDSPHCERKGKAPLLSLEAIHQLHLFIFALAITHVLLSALTMLLGGVKIQQWKHWEASIQTDDRGKDPEMVTDVNQQEFIKENFMGFDKGYGALSWLRAFVKQFYGSVTKSDYTTMRLGFIMTHCKNTPKYDFYKYMVRALESDFKRVVGISWYLWIFVVVFLVLNVHGWHIYFWMSFIPLILLLIIGTKLEHVITQLAHEVAEKHSVIAGDLIVNLSDRHFWFHQPRIILYLIHFILFRSAFEIAFFFWILITYGFDSCIMEQVGYSIHRLIISVIVQLLCSYSTLPLYAIVTQMGSSFHAAIFEEHMQKALVGWAVNAKKHMGQRVGNFEGSTKEPMEIQLQNLVVQKNSRTEEGIQLRNLVVQKNPATEEGSMSQLN